MTGELTRYRYEELQALAESAVASRMYKGIIGTDAAICLMQTALELGIPPMAALRGMHVIEGRVTLAADLMVALAKRHPSCEYFQLVASTATEALYETKRRGEQPTKLAWTIEDAKRADLLGKATWKRHPAAMLRARCAAALARAVYPDVLLGVYDGDEMEEIAGAPIDVEGEVIEVAELEADAKGDGYPQRTFYEMHRLSIEAAKDANALRDIVKRATRDQKTGWLSLDAYQEIVSLAKAKYERDFQAAEAARKGA